MMRWILLMVLFFAAVAIAPILIGEKGYLLIALGDTTIESSLVTACFALVLIFFVLMFLLKIFKGGFGASVRAWRKIAFAGRRRAIKDFNKGIAYFLLGDYKQAEHLLMKSAEPAERQQSAYLLAASAADKQGLRSHTEHYFSLLTTFEQENKTGTLESALVKIGICLSQQQYPHARALIDHYHKHIGHDDRLLSLEITLSLIEQRFETVIEYLNEARKSKTIEANKVQHWELTAFKGFFNQIISEHGNDALHQKWQSLSRKIKQREFVLFAYCQVLAENNMNEALNKLILPALKKEASADFIARLKTLPTSRPQELISVVQKHLQQDKFNHQWLSCLAHLALSGQDLILAEKAFHSLFQHSQTPPDRIDVYGYGSVLTKLGKYELAAELFLKYQNQNPKNKII